MWLIQYIGGMSVSKEYFYHTDFSVGHPTLKMSEVLYALNKGSNNKEVTD